MRILKILGVWIQFFNTTKIILLSWAYKTIVPIKIYLLSRGVSFILHYTFLRSLKQGENTTLGYLLHHTKSATCTM